MRKAATALLAAALLLLTACTNLAASTAPQPQDTLPPQELAQQTGRQLVQLEPSWAYSYADITEMVGDSDVVALVRLDSVAALEEAWHNTIYNITVLHGALGAETGAALQLSMMGGIFKDVIYYCPTFPYGRVGEEYLIFARQTEGGVLSMLGPQACMVYNNEELNPVSPLLSSHFAHQSLQEALAEVEAALPA